MSRCRRRQPCNEDILEQNQCLAQGPARQNDFLTVPDLEDPFVTKVLFFLFCVCVCACTLLRTLLHAHHLRGDFDDSQMGPVVIIWFSSIARFHVCPAKTHTVRFPNSAGKQACKPCKRLPIFQTCTLLAGKLTSPESQSGTAPAPKATPSFV